MASLAAVAIFSVVSACGSTSKSKAQTAATNANATATTGASATNAATTAPNAGIAVTAPASTQAKTATSSAAKGTADPCSIITPAAVQQATGIAATRDTASNGCEYNGPNGLFVIVFSSSLAKADQATFDAAIKAQEQGQTTPVPGLGDGAGASAKHDINVTTYAFKGKTLFGITVFQPASDPKSQGEALMKVLLSGI